MTLKDKAMIEEYTIVLNKSDKNRWNCVKYVRERIKNLPFGLWTLGDKLKIKNSCKAKVGRVAIMNVGWPWGHLGIVTGKGSNQIVIQEANYKAGKITERQGTQESLKIVGYFNPQKKYIPRSV